MEKSTRISVFALYIILFLLSTTSLSMFQLYINHSTTYSFYIEYEQHTATGTGYGFDHSYNTIIIDVVVTVDDFESVFSTFQVSNYPFWLDTSDWTDGETRTISGNLYSIFDNGGYWTTRRSWSDFEYESMNYNKNLGILIESHNDRLTLGSYGFTGSETDITIQHSNIHGFAARVTGNNLVGNILLLSGIFVEVLIIHWLFIRRRGE